MSEHTITILFQNEHFVVVDKPAGLNFHSEDDAGLAARVKSKLGVAQLYPVHRLDKMTSGLVIFALTLSAAQTFQQMFAAHQVQKWYLAISDQKPKKKQGWIKGDMMPARRGSWKLTKTQQNPAVTEFVSVAIQPKERLFLLRPETGKTHQLRVALKSVSAPICGDERYAPKVQAEQEERGYLHAYALRFNFDGTLFSWVLPPKTGQRFLSQACQACLNEWQTPWQRFKSTRDKV